MAGRGPAPKPRDRRARQNKEPIPLRVVHADPEAQPELPDGVDWHVRTRRWWRMWGESALAEQFTANDWSELMDTAFIHTQFWNGNASLASELRLRAAKFGATPEDRARLRIQVVTADEVESKAEARGNLPSSRSRYQTPQVG